MDVNDINQAVHGPLRRLLNDLIAVNSTAFKVVDAQGRPGFVGSKTETALLEFAQARDWPDYHAVREEAQVVQLMPFSSERKAMGVVMRLPDGRHRFLVKGASEILSKLATRHVYVGQPR